jgi:hypothetical protein
MEIQLPADIHERLSLVRRRHNRGILLFIPIYGVACLLIVRVFRQSSDAVLLSGLVLISILAAGVLIHRVRRTTQDCRELGLVCPNCRKILYEPKAGELLAAGRCPHCREHVFPARTQL